jgi:ATP-dependent DNA helicase RecQ
LVLEAEQFLKGSLIAILPRKQWPVGLFPDQKRFIPENLRNAPGRSLCYYGDAGWGKLVRTGKYEQSHFSNELVAAAAELIRNRWHLEPAPAWLTAIPSCRHPNLVFDLANRLAERLELPFYQVLQRSRQAPEQKTMNNGYMQAQNVFGTLCVNGRIPHTPVLLIDDIVDSGWTLTMAGYLLRKNGSGIVHPFTLAQATSRNK